LIVILLMNIIYPVYVFYKLFGESIFITFLKVFLVTMLASGVHAVLVIIE